MATNLKETMIKAEYFETCDGQPSILDLLIALDGAGASLASQASSVNLNDHDEIERMGDLGVAVGILAKQIRNRYYCGKPPAKRRRPNLEVVA